MVLSTYWLIDPRSIACALTAGAQVRSCRAFLTSVTLCLRTHALAICMSTREYQRLCGCTAPPAFRAGQMARALHVRNRAACYYRSSYRPARPTLILM